MVETIIEKNLEKMKAGQGEGSLDNFIGTTRQQDGKLGVEFYADSNTGEIKYFGFPQNVPEEIKQNFQTGSFIIKPKKEKSGFFRYSIISNDEGSTHYLKNETDIAKINLEKTIKIYNEKNQEPI